MEVLYLAQQAGQQYIILKEGSSRTKGRDAQGMNLMAARAVAEAVRTTLGPKGMDKMLVDSLGDVVITNDGVTILKEMDIEHPAAKMIVEVAKTQDDEVGDGTTTAVVLAGELLKRSESLLDQDVHPTVIAAGYRLAATRAREILDSLAYPVTIKDEDLLKKFAITAMTGKGPESAGEMLADLVVKSIKAVIDEDGKVDIDNIKVEKKVGGTVGDSELIQGLVIDKERIHPNMPKTVKNAKIVLIDTPLEIKKTEVDAKIEITSPDQLQKFLDQEEKMLKTMVDKIKATGANVVFCQKGVDDLVQHYLAKAGIMAARRVKESDLKMLAKATGARVSTSLDELAKEDLGVAGLVEERRIGDESMIFVEKCKDPKAVSMILRGGTEHVVDELERAVHDALRVVGIVVEPQSGQPLVVLQGKRDKRSVAMVIGHAEANGIAIPLRGITPPRPLTHDLFLTLFGRLKVTLTRVVITDLRDDIYYATLYLNAGGTEMTLDSRPSDAIALAIRAKVPVLVEDRVFDKGGISPQPPGATPHF